VWIATVISNIGIWLGNVGTAWLMTELRPTPVMVTLVQAAASLPVFLFALPAGAVGDLVDRRRLAIALQIVSTVLAMALGLATLLGFATPGVILVASFLFGTVLAFSMPVLQAVVPDLVPRSELAPAVSLNSVGVNVARVVGPALGGVLILIWGVAAPFFVDAVIYFAVAVALARWLPTLHRPSRTAERIVEAIGNGLRFTLGTPQTSATLVRSAGYAFCAAIYFALLPLIARDRLAGGPGIYGLLLGCIGAGGITAVILLPRLRIYFTPDHIARAGSLVTAALLVALAGSRSLWMAAPVLLAAGAAWVAVVATINVAAQVALPGWVRARGLSIFMVVFSGMMALGSAAWGLVANTVGIPLALVAAAAALVVFDLCTTRWRLPGEERPESGRHAER
jgi:MFS family permease